MNRFRMAACAALASVVLFTSITFAEGTTEPPTGDTTVSILSSDDSTTTTETSVVESTTTTTVPVTTTTVKPKPKALTKAQIRYLRAVRVNSLQYNWGDPKPAMEAFRLTALNEDWTPEQIKSWEIAIANIMMGESGFCPNVLRGAVMGNPQGCVLKRQGKHSDAGFGQLISIHYKLNSKNPAAGFLCREENLCSKWQIVASPYNSMLALVKLIERSGTRPWCYNSFARKYHRIACNNPGIDVP